jgi:serine/threonine protein kinase
LRIDKRFLKITICFVKAELTLMSSLIHPNIVRVLDSLEDIKSIYIILEYVNSFNTPFKYYTNEKFIWMNEWMSEWVNEWMSEKKIAPSSPPLPYIAKMWSSRSNWISPFLLMTH